MFTILKKNILQNVQIFLPRKQKILVSMVLT